MSRNESAIDAIRAGQKAKSLRLFCRRLFTDTQ